ncbi:FAD-dependent oxidoreductase [Gracilinema caldarium]|uniref:Glycerol-3-phosphate dehydrogenase n=1 Tax=Gracilinema caldarium (strain ATCC 51460 / DSM 7334 / H1) TaxID=744872 RepID=F8EZY9_GRAC1|nr:FAD-dependent oxidoreductase [Gracilinema caldarium]AEJ18502.1 Glycerol-3-phosphate dehydrogenase [Gracilinema caldarium DSM 7334]
MDYFDVVVIGGGGTGAATAYDLSLRGLSVILFERGELTSGTTGRHHGQLHSGARYALGDAHIAQECMAETRILRRIAGDAIEYNQGLFVALDDEGAALTPDFIAACREADIPAMEIPIRRALDMEPRINPKIKRAVLVPDGTIDAYRLAMRFFASAVARGASIRNYTEVLGIEGSQGEVQGVRVRQIRTGKESRIACRAIVNAAGPWADRVAALAHQDVPVTPAAGTMVAVEGRLANMVVSRLRRPGDGDIIVPQRRLSIIGSTQRKVDDPDGLRPLPEEISFLLSSADQLIPDFSQQPLRSAWTAARPLAGRSSDTGPDAGRDISRDIVVIDHGTSGTLKGLFTVLGGKATTLRIMGELVSDQVALYLGNDEPCRTSLFELYPYDYFWRLA